MASPTEIRIWTLTGSSCALSPDELSARVSAACVKLQSGWSPSPDTLRPLEPPILHLHTLEAVLPAAGECPADAAAAAFLESLGGQTDVAGAVLVLSSDPPPAGAASPRVGIEFGILADDVAGGPMALRWRVHGVAEGHRAEVARRLHRLAAAETALSRHRTVIRAYADELGRELKLIDRSTNQVLRFKIEGQDRPALIAQLEQNVKELSTNYAKLNRNAGIFRDIVTQQERLVEALQTAVAELRPEAVAGAGEVVFSRRLDRAQADLDECRQRERELQDSLHSAQTAITTQGMNIELLRSSELIELQKNTGQLLKKGVSLQAAAVLIELVVLFAYSLHAWEMLLGQSGFHAVPGWLRFLAPLLFSTGLVVAAHCFADYLKEGHFPKWAWAAVTGVVAALTAMMSAPYLFHTHEAPLKVRFKGVEYEIRSSGPDEHGVLDLDSHAQEKLPPAPPKGPGK